MLVWYCISIISRELILSKLQQILYFFGYKMDFFFPFQNSFKNLDLSYKTDLDLWDCLEGQNSYYSKIS